MVVKYYRIDIPEEKMSSNQRIIAKETRSGWIRDILGEDILSLHRLAGKVWSVYQDETLLTSYHMPSESELGFILLRLVEEGLVGMQSYQVEKNPKVKLLKTNEKAVLPSYSKMGDAGADVYSTHDSLIQPGERVLIDLGFKIEIENGWEIQVRPRSGLALKYGVTVLNTPGTIDSGYRGGCGVILFNSSSEPFLVNTGDRVAQFVIKKAPQANFSWTDKLNDSERGVGGFGSTGV